jgi:hypothetical protein
MPARKTTAAAATTAAAPRKPATRRPRAAKAAAAAPAPTHAAISERAYFIHLDEGAGDPVGHWLRAERELTPA